MLWNAIGLALFEAHLARLSLASPLPRQSSASMRLASMPGGLGVKERVVIHWNSRLIPFIEAQDDEDLAEALGLVHAHLRLGQMEMLRRLSQGRLAESIGPLGVQWDQLLRILNFGRVAQRILAALPEATRRWIEGFVRGVNHCLFNMETLPHEFEALALSPEPWTAIDILTLGRLAAADATWATWFGLQPLRPLPEWPKLWRRLQGSAQTETFAHRPWRLPLTPTGLISLGRVSGSSSVAISAHRSATGGALLGSVPHLEIVIPPPWLIVGMKSRSFHAVGLMAPGLPFIAMGRNPWIAWGGSNLHAASSDLFDVSGLAPDQIAERKETVKARWGFSRTFSVRETPLGPIVSDAPLFAAGRRRPIALRWMGHEPSDEFTALLALNRARNWQEFSAALRGFAVSGQDMLYAGADGGVGRILAVKLPRRPFDDAGDMVKPAEAAECWRKRLVSTDLPSEFAPPEGALVSANQPFACDAAPIGYFFSAGDRANRLKQLLSGDGAVSLARLSAALNDLRWDTSVSIRDALLRAARDANFAPPGSARRLIETLQGWDGSYEAGSRGALAFELLFYHFVAAYYDSAQRASYWATWRPRSLVLEDIELAAPGRLAAALRPALKRASRQYSRYSSWGAFHRLRLMHPLGLAPLFGRRYRFIDLPASGGCETLLKTAHPLTDQRHAASFGSGAQHISDLSDLDRNYFCLLGGQDGWLNSACFVDQVALWLRRDYIQIPLRIETVRQTFPHRTVLEPSAQHRQRTS